MCRSHADGGRLCPSQTDPVLIANRNARRRAAYAKKKSAGLLGHGVSHAKEAVFNHSVLNNAKYNKNAEIVYKKVGDDEKTPLGLTKKTYEGYLVEGGYFASQQLSGVIDYTKLDKDSYKEFGFQGSGVAHIRKEPKMGVDALWNASSAELSEDRVADKRAMRTFTSSEYKWINSALFGEGTVLKQEDEYQDVYNDIIDPDDVDDENPVGYMTRYVNDKGRTDAHLEEITRRMDTVLSHAPGQQRIVYRGVNAAHRGFGPHSVDDFVKYKYPLGQEVKFDGYQSTSYNPDIAAEYASGNGLVFEILASSGSHVTEVSRFYDEQEVILPRDSRFMVVGVHEKASYRTSSAENKDRIRGSITVVQMVEITEAGEIRDGQHKHTPKPFSEIELLYQED
jgi:hypothetical protein